MHQEKHYTQRHRLSQWHSQQNPEIPASKFCLQEKFLSMVQQEKPSEEMLEIGNLAKNICCRSL